MAKTNKMVEYGLDSANVTREIAAIDQATGYPRKWRK